MNAKIGMAPGPARSTATSMQAQLNALDSIASELLSTNTAAHFPETHGIAKGEPTIAPWSMASVTGARTLLVNAHVSATELLARITAEADAQDAASSNEYEGSAPPVVTFLAGISSYRSLLTRPRGLLELPAGVLAWKKTPGAFRSAFRPMNYISPKYAVAQGSVVKGLIRSSPTPRWIKAGYVAASNLKVQNLMDPDFIHGMANHRAAPPAFLDKLHVGANAVKNLKLGAAVVGKGFSALSVVSGAFSLYDGLSGKGDTMDTVDGIVNIVTGIGSFAPPPVGLVFAGVGAAYNLGRFLFTGAEGDRPIDHVVSFGKDVAKNVGDFAANNVKNAANAVNAAADVAGKVLDKVWPW